MTRPSAIFAASAFLSLAVVPAFATGVTKTWVSSTTGSDTGTCQFTTPCKTFAYAITQTLPGGELDVKDAGSYGPVTITQAISIVNVGFLAQISVPSGGIGVKVAAGSDDNVILQGLVIDGHGVGGDGIDFISGRTLTIEDCHLRNFMQYGINISLNSSANYDITRTEISKSHLGITVSGGTGILSQIDSHGNDFGVFVGETILQLISSTISANAVGLRVLVNATVEMGQTAITANGDGVSFYNGGIVNSYGDNYINANSNDITGGSLTGIPRR